RRFLSLANPWDTRRHAFCCRRGWSGGRRDTDNLCSPLDNLLGIDGIGSRALYPTCLGRVQATREQPSFARRLEAVHPALKLTGLNGLAGERAGVGKLAQYPALLRPRRVGQYLLGDRHPVRHPPRPERRWFSRQAGIPRYLTVVVQRACVRVRWDTRL